MTISPPPLILLNLTFKTLKPIGNLPFYHGIHWSALLREMLPAYLPSDMNMSGSGISIQTVETGRLWYDEADTINLGISFPDTLRDAIANLLSAFNDKPKGEGHLMPCTNIVLEDVRCRISNDSRPESWQVLDKSYLQPAIDNLMRLNEFTIQFITPLRLPRPEGSRTTGHRYCDTDYFEDPTSNPLNHIFSRIRTLPPQHIRNTNAQIVNTNLHWIDITYRKKDPKTIGGIVGKIKITGSLREKESARLVIGQYTGIGKNPAFGFGYYYIPEITTSSLIRTLSRGRSILHNAFKTDSLKKSLMSLPNSSPGEDDITINDLKKAGDEYLTRLADDFLTDKYVYGRLKTYKVAKSDGGFRLLTIQNSSDRLIHRALTDAITPIVETIISNSAYAYRKGLNIQGAAQALRNAIKEGYTTGIKADISVFFDTVNLDTLEDTLEGLLPFEPITERIIKAIRHIQQVGLPQGSPLSPVLSNLYLDNFDKAVERYGLKLIRYADDFVVLSKDEGKVEETLSIVEASLKKLGLKPKEEKITTIQKGSEIKFLGYIVSDHAVEPYDKEVTTSEYHWKSAFREEIADGIPVYITSLCRGAFSKGNELIVKMSDEQIENIPWNKISRLVIVGRASFTGGVIYRAMKESIPVTFIDIMGRAHGRLYPDYYEMPDFAEIQRQYSKDYNFCLSFTKSIISAKINNSSILLKRNGIDSTALDEFEQKVMEATNVDVIRGYEGASAKIYWQEFANLVAPFEFKGRIYHPPDNIVNVMLSLGYTLLYNRITTAITDAGVNPKIGFFHQGRGSHCALASDLLEQARHIVERIVLSLIHKKEIKPEDVQFSERKGTNVPRLGGEGFRKFIHRYETTMSTKTSYFGKQKMSYNAWIDEAVQNLKRAMKLNITYKALRIR